MRAVRVFTENFFDWLGLLPILNKERERASKALRKRAAQLGKSVSDLMKRLGKTFKPISIHPKVKPLSLDIRRAWNEALAALWKLGVDTHEAQRQVNQRFGFPPDWSPGQGAPR